ncbi:hypothetical protein IF2G_07255 [Cordyceps javanica]|nr:hypothetical protein IF2G_07255 [Cordyceps javanica]
MATSLGPGLQYRGNGHGLSVSQKELVERRESPGQGFHGTETFRSAGEKRCRVGCRVTSIVNESLCFPWLSRGEGGPSQRHPHQLVNGNWGHNMSGLATVDGTRT